MSDSGHDDWVRRVLGVDISASSAPPAGGNFTAAWQAWQDALETVDAQISQLQSALKAQDDDELQEISEYGLNGVTGGFKVKLMAALMGVQRGNEGDKAKLPGLIDGLRDVLDSDERIEACDENPFGVAVTIRSTIGGALDGLAAAI